MSDVEPEPIYDEATGEIVGYALEASDGAVVGVDLAGQIVGAVDPQTGAELDPAEYGYADELEGADDELELDPRLEDYDARLAELEQRASEPVQVEYVDGGPDLDAAADDAAGQLQSEELKRGHPLTRAQTLQIMTRVREQVDAGYAPDVAAAIAQMSAEGEPLPDLDSGARGQRHQARVDLMVGRFEDQERDDREQELGEPDPPAREFADLDNGQERREFMADRLAGRASADQAYSSSDYDAEGGDE